jgi:uncharacterized membrane protein
LADVESPDPPLLDLTLRPRRSLTPRGFRWLMLAMAAASTIYSLPFYLMGAWPVVGFLGLDVLLVYWAFRVNFNGARAFEHLRVGYHEMSFARVTAKGQRNEWRFNPLWVKLERFADEDFGLLRLWLRSRERRWEIGGFLGPEQREEAEKQLSRALADARRGPRFQD